MSANPRTTTRASSRVTTLAALLALAPLSASQDEPQAGQQAGQEVQLPDVSRFVVVGAGGAVLRNLADRQGLALVEAPADTPLAVRREQGDWLLVEPPGGVPVWVYGRFLAETGAEDVLVVTANAVLMRPRPSSDVTSFPLLARLHGQDQVRRIRRADPSLPFDEDWVQVWSPPGAAAWVRAEETAPLPAGVGIEQRWGAVLAAGGLVAPSGPAGRTPGSEESTGEPTAGQPGAPGSAADPALVAARAALLEASRALAEERGAGDLDLSRLDAIEAGFRSALELDPDGPTGADARRRLEVVAALREAAALRAEIEAERLRREQELIRRQEEIWEEARLRDPLSHRFDARGVLVSRQAAGELERYFLTWREETGALTDVCEVVCRTGRFELELFAGCELGVMATTLQKVRVVGDAERAAPRVLDIARIEVIAAR